MMVQLEFGGGLELLFHGQKAMKVEVPADQLTLGKLVIWIRQHLITERHEMFAQGDEIRPGVLILVNEVDWELEGKASYEVVADDVITFISTLHGG